MRESGSTAAAAGFSLVELLVAAAVSITLGGALLRMMTSASAIARAQPAVADLQQRARVALDAVGRDLAKAGTGFDGGPFAGTLAQYLPPLSPSLEGGVTVWYVSSRDAQGELVSGADVGSTEVTVRSATCPAAQSACAFAPSASLLLVDAAGCYALARVDAVTDVALQLHAPISGCAVLAGGAVAQADARSFHVDPAAHQLMRRDESTAIDVPVLDGVDSMQVEYFDDVAEGARAIDPSLEPRSLRRVRVTLRLTASDTRAGVPPLVFSLDVAPANLSLR